MIGHFSLSPHYSSDSIWNIYILSVDYYKITHLRNQSQTMAIINKNSFFAQQFLEQGEVIAIPTETVYGLAANAYDPAAVGKIFAIKNRPLSNPLIVHVGKIEQLYELVDDIPPLALCLAKHFWPGPLTLLLPKKNRIPDLVTAHSAMVAVRIPNHPTTLQLLACLSFPLAAPSANLFGHLSPTTSTHVQEQLGKRIPYILEGGQCSVGIESTIIGFESQEMIIYRLGSISVEALREVVGPVVPIHTKQISRQTFTTPGSALQHYAPNKVLKIGDVSILVSAHQKQKIGILGFDSYYNYLAKEQQILLSAKGCLAEAAYNLFAALQILDAMNIEVILSSYVPDIGIGRAINDRLMRASFH